MRINKRLRGRFVRHLQRIYKLWTKVHDRATIRERIRGVAFQGEQSSSRLQSELINTEGLAEVWTEDEDLAIKAAPREDTLLSVATKFKEPVQQESSVPSVGQAE